MKNKSILHFIAGSVFVCVLASPSTAERILFLDASAPGDDPENQWNDLSASQYHFANSVESPATYNAANGSYDFETSNSLRGTGDSTLFDFDTEFNETDGIGTPFSIVAYVEKVPVGDRGYNILSKTDEPGTGQWLGWMLAGNPDAAGRYDFSMQPGNNADRLYARTDDGTSGPMLLVVTHDGSGYEENVNWYVNGQGPTSKPYAEDWLVGTIVNDNDLVIGSTLTGPAPENTGWSGSIYFLEVFDTVLTEEEVTARWNGGAVARVGMDSPVVDTTTVAGTGVVEISFNAFNGTDHAVQYTDDGLISPTWTTHSTITGKGKTARAYDVDGSPARNYRYVLQ